MKLSEIKELLERHQIQLTKSLGQNFMHDQNQIRRIVEAAAVAPGERVLEIGPGLGPLTELLLANGAEVLAVELDRRLAGLLLDRLASAERLTVVEADALQYVVREDQDWSGWKIVSNLPYSVASRLLVDLAWGKTRPARMVITVQREVAWRIQAQKDADEYGVLGLLLQLYYRPEGYFRLPAGSFFPKPEVDSACLTLVRRETAPLSEAQARVYRDLVKGGFSQRRKMMVKLLRSRWPEEKLLAGFASLSLTPQVRAEKVSREQFMALARFLAG